MSSLLTYGLQLYLLESYGKSTGAQRAGCRKLETTVYERDQQMTEKDIFQLYKDNGFWLKRQKNHYIWTDGVSTIAMAKTASDWRAMMNKKTILRRACQKAGREFIDGGNMDYRKPFNSVQIKEDPIKTQIKTRPLDAESLEICQAGFKQQVSQNKILDNLVALGYTNPNGRALDQSDISRYMRSNNMWYRRPSDKPAAPEIAPMRRKPVDKIIDRIAEVAMSNLSADMKREVIIKYATELAGGL